MKTFVCVALMQAFLLVAPVAAAPIPPDLVDACVMVDAKPYSGSGVIFKNGDSTFCWTAGHVVQHLQKVEVAIDPKTGLPRVFISYKDVKLVQKEVVDGRIVSETATYAQIVRYSAHDRGGEDLALLRIYKTKAYSHGVKFLDEKTIPKVGEALWHVGSMAGTPGYNQTAEGVFSFAGRLRGQGLAQNDLTQPIVMDSISLPALAGSSGGGVFLKSDSLCIGLLTQGLSGQSESINCIVPARAVWAYAKRAKCEWAVNDKVVVPKLEIILDAGLITDRPVAVPVGATTATPAAPPEIIIHPQD